MSVNGIVLKYNVSVLLKFHNKEFVHVITLFECVGIIYSRFCKLDAVTISNTFLLVVS
jgi:hypothetical protein